MQYSRRIKQKTLEELSPSRRKQVDISASLEDMVLNNIGWKQYESWLEDQYLYALNSLKTCELDEVLECQITIQVIESLKKWMVDTIEKGKVIGAKLLSETTEGGI